MKMFRVVRAALYEATGTTAMESRAELSKGGFLPRWLTGLSRGTPWPRLEPKPFFL